MNRASLLHIIEKLETFVGKLPATIQKPITHELTPLKELFLLQRPPRFVITGANTLSLQEVVAALFAFVPPAESRDILMELFRWHPIDLSGRGTIAVLDARAADAVTRHGIQEELQHQSADVFLHLADDASLARDPKRDLANLAALIGSNNTGESEAKVVGIVIHDEKQTARRTDNGEIQSKTRVATRLKLQDALQEELEVRKKLLQIFELQFTPGGEVGDEAKMDIQRFMSLLARQLPNEARIEMVRIANDREAQIEIAQMLVKSTTAICAAIGAQPIPLADLPILTTLQLAMVSGIMYISGRERSLRAATEFVGALGVNVGAGMILREGTRALLKFFPGWGNVVCGVVAGAGTYAIGRAAIVFFLEGVSLKEARKTYLASRKKRAQSRLRRTERIEAPR